MINVSIVHNSIIEVVTNCKIPGNWEDAIKVFHGMNRESWYVATENDVHRVCVEIKEYTVNFSPVNERQNNDGIVLNLTIQQVLDIL